MRRIGNSLGVIFPKDLVDAKGIRERDKVDIDPKPVRDFSQWKGVFRKWGLPHAAEINRQINEGEEL